MMIGNVKSSYKTSSATLKTTAGALHNISSIATAAAGTVTLRDGGASGTIIWQMGTAAIAGVTASITFAGAGIPFSTNLYVELTNAYASVGWS